MLEIKKSTYPGDFPFLLSPQRQRCVGWEIWIEEAGKAAKAKQNEQAVEIEEGEQVIKTEEVEKSVKIEGLKQAVKSEVD
jgi:hypothetical protein